MGSASVAVGMWMQSLGRRAEHSCSCLVLLLLDANSGLPARDSSSVAGEGAGMSELRRKVPLIPHIWVKQNRAYIHHHNILETSSVCLLSVSVCCVSCVFCFSSPDLHCR